MAENNVMPGNIREPYPLAQLADEQIDFFVSVLLVLALLRKNFLDAMQRFDERLAEISSFFSDLLTIADTDETDLEEADGLFLFNERRSRNRTLFLLAFPANRSQFNNYQLEALFSCMEQLLRKALGDTPAQVEVQHGATFGNVLCTYVI